MFTLYMMPDPDTLPIDRRNQNIIGASVGFVYEYMIFLGVRFTIMLTLAFVCMLRGAFQ